MADDFVPALNGLLDRTDPPEHIVIETSGLALPKPLVQAFNWPAIASRVTVDGVVAVIDAAAVAEGRFADDPEPWPLSVEGIGRSITTIRSRRSTRTSCLCADLVVLNKTDLIGADQLNSLRAEIAGALPRAVKIAPAREGAVGADVLLGMLAAAEDDLSARPSHHDAEGEHDHDDFDTFVVSIPAIRDPARVDRPPDRGHAYSRHPAD